MKALLIVESCFGSTRALAEEVAAGLRKRPAGRSLAYDAASQSTIKACPASRRPP